MDRELAGAVFRRWDQGLPVAETNLYKAASVLGVDPDAALAEARYYTALDRHLMSGESMSDGERVYFSAAAGWNSNSMDKLAGAYGLTPDELIIHSLRERDFQPALEKLALMPPPELIQEMIAQQAAAGGDGGGGQQQPGQEEAMAAGPQQGAVVQQQPQARVRPSPTAPEQIPASQGGNMQALLEELQGVHGDQAAENGGLPPANMPEPPPAPPSPEERIQQVAPGMDPETTGRYAQKLQEFEQQMQMPITDPKQMVKFVQALQKVDSKYIDQGIKEMAQQAEQEMGIGTQVQPTVPGFGQQGAGGAVAGGGAAQGGAGAGAGADGDGSAMAAGPPGSKPSAKPPAPQAAQAAGAPPQSGQAQQQAPQEQEEELTPEEEEALLAAEAQKNPQQQGKPPGKKPPPQMSQQMAEKVAQAARAMALINAAR
jgi:hypothetical protein